MGAADGESLGTVIKAMRVLQLFSQDLPRATTAEVANAAQMTRPSARRILLTFVQEGFIESDGKYYWPTPKVLRLGFSYLSTLPFWQLAEAPMRSLAEAVDESCSLATLDGHDVVYVARVPLKRSLIQLNIGSRLPAHATSLGKALLAFSPEYVIEEFLATAPFEAITTRTAVTREALSTQLKATRDRGFAINDGEREIGVRSIAAPILTRRGEAMAAINLSANAMRVSLERLRVDIAPALLRTAREISDAVAYSGRL